MAFDNSWQVSGFRIQASLTMCLTVLGFKAALKQIDSLLLISNPCLTENKKQNRQGANQPSLSPPMSQHALEVHAETPPPILLLAQASPQSFLLLLLCIFNVLMSSPITRCSCNHLIKEDLGKSVIGCGLAVCLVLLAT
jgi:hypothetical protein